MSEFKKEPGEIIEERDFLEMANYLEPRKTPTCAHYKSQMNIMRAKAVLLGISPEHFESICMEKSKIAQSRFVAESQDWQAWFAESMVWSFFFKDNTPFPGVEPARLYPLRSSTSDASTNLNVQADMWKKHSMWQNGQAKCPVGGGPTRTGSNVEASQQPKMFVAAHYTTDRYQPPPLQPAPRPASAQESDLSTPLGYRTLESIMEKMARAQGGPEGRSEFFRFLQQMRDRSRKEHGACDSTYRAYFADLRTWNRFFHERFPGKEPVGPGVHHASCRGSRQIENRLGSVPGPTPAAAPRMTRVFSSPHRDRDLPQARDDEVPRDIMEKLRMCNSTSSHGRDERVLMIDKFSLVYSQDDVRQKFEAFSHIDPDAKAVAEKSLGCRLRARLLQSGDCVLFCLPFAMGDQVAVDKGIKFLKDWERKDSSERNNGRLLDFLQVSKDFFDPACVVDSGLHSHQLLINGRAIRLSPQVLAGICDSFSADIDGRSKVESALNCRFTLIDPSQDHTFKAFKITASDKIKSLQDREVITKEAYKFLETWIEAAHKTLVFEDMRMLPIAEYHQNYKAATNYDAERLLIINRGVKTAIACSDAAVKSLAYSLLVDKQKSVVERTVQCQFVVHERLRDDGIGLTLQIIPVNVGVPRQLEDAAVRMFVSWAKKALKDEKLKLSAFWETWNAANPASYALRAYLAANASADVPLPPSDADSEWEKYAAAFGASEIDRMLVEEQVKVERKLRMVLDEETQDIITLGEFEARIKHRSRGLKRQLDGGEDVEWAEKRVKY